jgi:toxin-antitoxin system PIN domain toxin
LSRAKYLLDVNVLIALTEQNHAHYKKAMEWFDNSRPDWGLCAFSEAGYLRITSNPNLGGHSVGEAEIVLEALIRRHSYRYWPITGSWSSLVAPFAERIYGRQQITDAYLLGLAIKENGVLVTLDKAIRYMAGPQCAKHLLVLE